jgi:hypothetical protein
MKSKWSADLERAQSWRESFQRLLQAPNKTERQLAWQEEVLKNLEDGASINMELQDAGVPFDVGELTNVQTPYPEVIAVLVKHLRLPHRPDVEESVIRALGVRYGGKEVFRALLDYLYARRIHSSGGILYALGNSLALVASKGDYAELERVTRDQANRNARLEPLLRLAKAKRDGVGELAKSWLSDDRTAWFALRALRLAKDWSAAHIVREFLGASNAAIRAEARRYVKARDSFVLGK